jgi:DNA-binding Lrp family transcriptional regulator
MHTPKQGGNMKAFVLVKIRAGDVGEVVRQLKAMESVVEAHMTFGPYDAIAVIDSSDLSSIGTLISSSIQPIDGIEQTLTCLVADI